MFVLSAVASGTVGRAWPSRQATDQIGAPPRLSTRTALEVQKHHSAQRGVRRAPRGGILRGDKSKLQSNQLPVPYGLGLPPPTPLKLIDAVLLTNCPCGITAKGTVQASAPAVHAPRHGSAAAL
jgi:hypothetical protein